MFKKIKMKVNHSRNSEFSWFRNFYFKIKKKSYDNLPPAHVYPLGQQCTPSEQQTAFGKGQHPYSPDESLQQVFPLGH